ncbi:HPP family protein [Chromobacterium sp. ATCC 53434]|uniref:HPP family protein n=1 Tax=Chromobacterium sp. (strain ATCC 53434 / SC 14030) TaxID=2059672 RepID=UPI0018F11FB7|nr:HPP family protein [Chromobacterium sp. ATCC 53434]
MEDVRRQLGDWLRRFWPQAIVAGGRDRLAGSLGAALGLIATEWLCRHALGAANPWFIAPMGASAVLLFAVPASPLAQPWSIVGGNLCAALVGVSCARLIGDPGLAAGVAVAAAIALMFPLRCLHPPSGAVALTAVLGGPAVARLGYGFVWHPVLINSLLLAALALLINRLAGRRYPHSAPATPAPTPSERVGVSRADLHAALAERGELVDVSEDDLEEILQLAEERLHQRRFGALRCADFMVREVLSVHADASCAEALALLRSHRFDALPVASTDGRLLGEIGLRQLMAVADASTRVGQLMDRQPHTSRPDDSIERLIHPFADRGVAHSMVLDDDGRLLGLVAQGDLIAALFREQLERPAG